MSTVDSIGKGESLDYSQFEFNIGRRMDTISLCELEFFGDQRFLVVDGASTPETLNLNRDNGRLSGVFVLVEYIASQIDLLAELEMLDQDLFGVDYSNYGQ